MRQLSAFDMIVFEDFVHEEKRMNEKDVLGLTLFFHAALLSVRTRRGFGGGATMILPKELTSRGVQWLIYFTTTTHVIKRTRYVFCPCSSSSS